MLSPSEQFKKYLSKSGFTLLPEECKGRTKWHFCYEERDGFTHYGFVEQKDQSFEGSVLEIDRRYRPMDGFPMANGIMTNLYLHVVLDKDSRYAAIMTPWSFFNLDEEQPSVWDESLCQYRLRVPPSSYFVVDMNCPTSQALVTMEEVVDA